MKLVDAHFPFYGYNKNIKGQIYKFDAHDTTRVTTSPGHVISSNYFIFVLRRRKQTQNILGIDMS